MYLKDFASILMLNILFYLRNKLKHKIRFAQDLKFKNKFDFKSEKKSFTLGMCPWKILKFIQHSPELEDYNITIV